MLEDLFKPYGCTITRFGTGNVTIASYRIKNVSMNIDCSFSWDSKDNLGITLKPIINEFISILCNGIGLNQYIVYDRDKILELIDTSYLKLTPEQKLNNVL